MASFLVATFKVIILSEWVSEKKDEAKKSSLMMKALSSRKGKVFVVVKFNFHSIEMKSRETQTIK